MTLYVLALTALLLVIPAAAQELHVPPQVITELKTYYPDTSLVTESRPECLIVYADEPGYEQVAQQVAVAIRAASGTDVPMKTEADYTEADRNVNLICLGRMSNNRLALELYNWRYIAADDWFPGPEGYELRTVHDPWGNGKNVIMLGGSDLDGVRLVVEQFAAMLPRGDTVVIPRTIRTQFKGTENLDAFTQAAIARFTEDFIDLKALPYGAQYGLVDCAELYYATGRDEFAQTYARMLRRWMDEYYRWTSDWQIEEPKYTIPLIIRTLDLVEESPLIAGDLKLEMTNLLYDYCSRLSVHNRITGLQPGVLSVQGHHNVSETVIYGADYFRRYYPDADLERLDSGVEKVRIGHESIARSHGVLNNAGGYTVYYPTTAMRLALAMGNHDFFTGGAARKWMEHSILVTDSFASAYYGHSASFAIAAWYYQDPTYVWFNNWRSGRSDYHPEMTATEFNRWLWTYLPKMDGQVPADMSGLRYMRLHEINYRQMDSMGKFINVPRERAFSYLAMREGFGREYQYLRLDGINDSIFDGGNGNAIATVSDGQPWLSGVGAWGGGVSMKWYNSALVLRDGQMTDRLVALTDLQVACELPTTVFVRSVMSEYNGMDWGRNIAWIKGKYWVVMDQFAAREADDYSVMCQWYHGAESVDDQYRAIRSVRGHTFVLQAAGGSKPFVTFLDDGRPIVRQAVHGQMASGEEMTIAHLMYGHPEQQEHDYSVLRVDDNQVLVTEPDRHVLIGLAALGSSEEPLSPGGQLQARCTMFALAPDEISFAGLTSLGIQQPLMEADKPMDVHVDFTTGRVTAIAAEATRVRLRGLQAAEDMVTAAAPGDVSEMDLDAGEHRAVATIQAGPLAVLVAAVQGAINQAAQMAVAPGEEHRPRYSRQLAQQWHFQVPDGENVTIQVMRSADVDGDAVAEVLVGTDDGRLFCLNADGSQRWVVQFEPHPEQGSSRGHERAAVNDIAVADFGEGPRILVASDSQYLHCLDGDGEELWRFTGVGFECRNETAQGVALGVGQYVEGDGEMMVVDVDDINGDGNLEILVGSRTRWHGPTRVFGTLWCLNPQGQLRWHLYQRGGTVNSIATFDPDGDGQKLINFGCGSQPYGRGSWVCDNQGNPLIYHTGGSHGLFVAAGRAAPDGSYRLVRLQRRDGNVWVYDAAEPFQQLWTFRAGGLDAVGPELADLTGDGIVEIIVGSDGGSLFCLNDREEPLTWRASLGEPLSAVATGDLGLDNPGIVAGSAVGGVMVVAGDGTPLALASVGAPVQYVAALKLRPDQPGLAVAGTTQGSVTAFTLE